MQGGRGRREGGRSGGNREGGRGERGIDSERGSARAVGIPASYRAENICIDISEELWWPDDEEREAGLRFIHWDEVVSHVTRTHAHSYTCTHLHDLYNIAIRLTCACPHTHTHTHTHYTVLCLRLHVAMWAQDAGSDTSSQASQAPCQRRKTRTCRAALLTKSSAVTCSLVVMSSAPVFRGYGGAHRYSM